MTDPTPTSASQVRRPMISEEEVGDLAERYGEPVRHALCVARR